MSQISGNLQNANRRCAMAGWLVFVSIFALIIIKSFFVELYNASLSGYLETALGVALLLSFYAINIHSRVSNQEIRIQKKRIVKLKEACRKAYIEYVTHPNFDRSKMAFVLYFYYDAAMHTDRENLIIGKTQDLEDKLKLLT